jgi:hypothetical protein
MPVVSPCGIAARCSAITRNADGLSNARPISQSAPRTVSLQVNTGSTIRRTDLVMGRMSLATDFEGSTIVHSNHHQREFRAAVINQEAEANSSCLERTRKRPTRRD